MPMYLALGLWKFVLHVELYTPRKLKRIPGACPVSAKNGARLCRRVRQQELSHNGDVLHGSPHIGGCRKWNACVSKSMGIS
jgi:hypothetical protein